MENCLTLIGECDKRFIYLALKLKKIELLGGYKMKTLKNIISICCVMMLFAMPLFALAGCNKNRASVFVQKLNYSDGAELLAKFHYSITKVADNKKLNGFSSSFYG